MRGRVRRGEQQNCMMRVKVSELEKFAAKEAGGRGASRKRSASSQDDEVRANLGQMIDLSTPESARRFFGKHASSEFVAGRVQMLSIAHGHKEVLVPWRGCIPAELFEMIDSDSGLAVDSVTKWGTVKIRAGEVPTECVIYRTRT